MAARKKMRGFIFLFSILQPAILSARTIRVPNDFFTIKSAVAASRAGDIVEVEDGIYFENNIIIDKDIVVRAKNLYGAVIYGTAVSYENIFLVRAKTEIAGFIIKNSGDGILQRDSPDVRWRAHDLILLNMSGGAISINDREKTVGGVLAENLIIDHCGWAVVTNDAHDILVRNSIIMNCGAAFAGFDHLSFKVERTALWNCPQRIKTLPFSDIGAIQNPQATNRIDFGRDVDDIESLIKNRNIKDIHSFLMKILDAPAESAFRKAGDFEKRTCLADKITGDIFYDMNDFGSAGEHYRAALHRSVDMGSGELALSVLYKLAMISDRNGNFREAIDYYKKAVEAIDQIVAGVPFKYIQTGFFDDKIEIYDSLLFRLFQMQKIDGREEWTREAFYYSEKSKSIGLLESLLDPQSKSVSSKASDLDSRGAAISKEIARLQILLYRQEISEENKRIVYEKIKDTEDGYKAFLIQQRKNSILSGLKTSELFRYEQLDELLPKLGTALIEYFVGSKHAFGFCMTKNSSKMIMLPDPDSLNSWVPNYLEFLTLENKKEFLGITGGRKLFELLMGDFYKELTPDIDKIIIIPDGVLNYLPFEALIQRERKPSQSRNGDQTAPGRYLVEDYEVSYAPSASCLVQLMKRRELVKRRMDLLVIANPGKGAHQGRANKLSADFPELVYAEQEARVIGRYFDKARRTVLIGQEATEKFVKSQELADYRIIHFASHGRIDDRYWWRSALLLNSFSGDDEDGLLQPFDIMMLKQMADMIVLSACQTGGGRFVSGEGLMGLSNSFFVSGAKAVLSSFWRIDDRSATLFMDRFYSYLAEGETIGHALRRSKLDMLRSKYSHPVFWAAFFLTGNHASLIQFGDATR